MSESDTQKLQHQIVELKVSGHTMALDPGLYCVFSAPNSVAPSAETGLPTVRISAGPGPVPGRVEVVGLHESGWIGPESATLVRVANARSTVLVTVYQAKDTRAEAPQIQVVRISAEPGAAQGAAPGAAQGSAPAAIEGPPASVPARGKPREVHVVAHIYGRGDVGGELGEWIGEAGSKRWIEGFAVAPAGEVPSTDLEYQAVLGRGWLSPWSEGGQFCGSRSMALPILGLRVRLRGASAATHRVALSATFIDGTKVGPVSDGEPCEAASLAALEAFHLEFEPAVARAPSSAVPKPARVPASKSGTAKAAKAKLPVHAQPAAPKRPAKPGPAPEPAAPAAAKVKAPARAAVPELPEPARAKRPATPRAARTPAPTRRR